MNDVMRTGRPPGAKDRPPVMSPRRTARLVRDTLAAAERGDLTAKAVVLGAVLLSGASTSALQELRNG